MCGTVETWQALKQSDHTLTTSPPQGEGQTWEIDLDSSEIPEVYDYTTGEYPDEAA